MMTIGIDASRAFIDKRTGTEEYSYQIITHLLRLADTSNIKWVLYTKKLINKNEIIAEFSNTNLKIIEIKLPYLWTQIGLALHTWVDRLDVLWVPAHTLPLLRRPGLKTVVTIHGIEYEWLPAYENPLQRLYLPLSTQYAVMSASRIIAVSDFTKNQLVSRLGADKSKIKVIHEGVSANENVITKKETSLEKYGLIAKQYILFIGTIQPRKNLVRLITAFKQLLSDPKFQKLKLLVIGKWGWSFSDVLKTIQDPELKDHIVTVGYTSNAERDTLLHNGLVYVQPSITEGFGLPVLEAMSHRVPVVSSFGGALKEVVGDAGILFDPYDISDMSHKLELVIGNPTLQKQLIAKGLRQVKLFSWQRAALQTLKVLEY